MAEPRSAYVDALYMLGRRELSVAQCTSRLAVKGHPADEIDAAVARLLESRALDDARVARAHVRTAINLKGRGRLRIQRELQTKGLDKEVIAAALADMFDDVDEGALIVRAVKKRLRGRAAPADRAEAGRLYQYLLRQGFPPSKVVATLRQVSTDPSDD